MSARVWVVIVNYRTGALVVDCLVSLEKQLQNFRGGRVVVIDNDSGDTSVECIKAAIAKNNWDKWADIVSLKTNGGFAFGNNAGVAMALSSENKPDYILFLNPDTIARTGAIKHLSNFLDSNKNVGIVGSSIENINGNVEISAHRYPSPVGELEGAAKLGLLSRLLSQHVVSPPVRTVAHECDWISGASFMVRRSVLEEVGQMDESFFLYYEEVDYCQRAKNKGWSTWYVPESRVMHIEGAATGICEIMRRPSYWYDSRRRYFVKHYGIGRFILADLLWSIGRVSFLLRRLLRLGAQGENNDPKWYMLDLLWGDLRAIVSREVWRISQERSN